MPGGKERKVPSDIRAGGMQPAGVREGEEGLLQLYLAALSEPGNNNIQFTWRCASTDDTDSDAAVKRAFRAADRKDLFRFVPVGLLGDFYITDVPQTAVRSKKNPGDSRMLSMKYGEDAKLEQGQTYYICQI